MAESVLAVEESKTEAGDAAFGPQNPFHEASTLPFGAPPFDLIKDEDYEPALLAGIAAEMLEVRAIADDSAAATFENTLVALERSGALLHRVSSAFGVITGAFTNPLAEQVQQRMAPKFAALHDAIYLDAKLFARVETLYEQRANLALDAESVRLLELYYRDFLHGGAKLGEADKATLMALNAEESTLSNAFNQRLLAANNAATFVTTDAAALAGLSDAELESAAAMAKARGAEGFVIPLRNTTQQPVLAKLTVRATRQVVFEASLTRTERGDDNDLRATVARLAQLRAEKAKLLGFASYAAWKLDDQMAKTPAAAVGFLDAMVPDVLAKAQQEQCEIQALIDAQGGGFAVQAWDWEFYAEQVRKAKYDLDEAELRPYFELNAVLQQGVFLAATKLFGITFKERYDLPVYAPDVRRFEIDNADGSHLALFYCDFWKRDNKRGGAWMSSFVRQSRLLNAEPVIYNICNFAKPAEGQPALISFDDVTTMFHEFGHALHGMFSDAMYPSLAGTSVPRDFVEFPSQFNEHWATEPEIFAAYARHCDTGEAMPEQLAAKLKHSASFNEGYNQTELVAAAQLDMEWHSLADGLQAQDSISFEASVLEKKGIALEPVPPRYRSTYFAHIFGGGYAAGYYAYLWSEKLKQRGYAWFEQHGGLTRANGDRFRKMILSRGNTEELGAMFERWIGEED